MKKTRLLEIIREEIDIALNEIPDFGGRFDTQVADKYGEEDTLESITNKIVDEVLKDMKVSREDLKKDKETAKEILKTIRKKVVGKNQDPRVTAALEKQEDFDDSGSLLQANQTNNFILKALGLKEPGKRGRKASPKTSEPTTASEPKPSKVDFDDEAPSGDMEMEKAARGTDALIKQYQNVMNTFRKKKEEEGNDAAIKYLKTKQDIVKKYKKAQKVEA